MVGGIITMAGGGITDGVGIMAGDGDITVGAGADMGGAGVIATMATGDNGLLVASG